MSDLIVQIRFAEELEEWRPSYPGDPMIRPASYTYDIRYNERSLLEEWLNRSTPSYKVHWSALRHPINFSRSGVPFSLVSAEEFPNGWSEAQVCFYKKSEAMLFKLAFS